MVRRFHSPAEPAKYSWSLSAVPVKEHDTGTGKRVATSRAAGLHDSSALPVGAAGCLPPDVTSLPAGVRVVRPPAASKARAVFEVASSASNLTAGSRATA